MKNFILATLLGTFPFSVIAQGIVNVCDPHEFFNLEGPGITVAIEDFIWNAPENARAIRLWDSWNQPRSDLYRTVFGQPCDSQNNTPLHRAIQEHQWNLAGALIRKNAPLYAANADGETPRDMIKRMMNAQDFSDDKMDMYARIHRDQHRTYSDRYNHLFQDICRSDYGWNDYIVHPFRSTNIGDVDRARFRSWVHRQATHVLSEYNLWLIGLTRDEFRTLAPVMSIYRSLRSLERIPQLDARMSSMESHRKRMDDDRRCSDRPARRTRSLIRSSEPQHRSDPPHPVTNPYTSRPYRP